MLNLRPLDLKKSLNIELGILTAELWESTLMYLIVGGLHNGGSGELLKFHKC